MTLAPGTPVLIRDAWPELDGPVHCRTPHYVRGHRGRIVRHLGDFPDPGDIAFARPATIRSLYHVALPLADLWPEARRAPGPTPDDLVIEIYSHWLDEEKTR